MLTIDGSHGEGGGQILRSALALSMVTRTPFRIERIRARRSQPGLRRQHLAAVLAATKVGRAKVTGAAVGSTELCYRPEAIRPGDYNFDVGSAGSTTLVFQTVLPALLAAEGPSSLVLEGGTHNPLAPPFDFLDRSFLPLVRRMGANVNATLERPGFFPAGGGRFTASIEPAPRLNGLDLTDRGEIRSRAATILLARLPRHIAEREAEVVLRETGWPESSMRIDERNDSRGPGNVVLAEIVCDHVTEVVAAFGRRGVRAEEVAAEAVAGVRQYLDSNAPVGEHLADQLLLPLALAGSGRFSTLALSGHATTHIDLIRWFLDVRVNFEETSPGEWIVEVQRPMSN